MGWDSAMAESHESAETHDRVGHTSGHLVDDEVVDLTNVLVGRSVDLSTLDVFARNAFVVGMGGCACQVIWTAIDWLDGDGGHGRGRNRANAIRRKMFALLSDGGARQASNLLCSCIAWQLLCRAEKKA